MKRIILADRRDNYFGEQAAFKYGQQIVTTLGVGATVSKRKTKAYRPGGLVYEAEQLGIAYTDLLEALEGMCADGRVVEHETEEDSWYEIVNSKRHPARTLFYDETRDSDSIWKDVTSSATAEENRQHTVVCYSDSISNVLSQLREESVEASQSVYGGNANIIYAIFDSKGEHIRNTRNKRVCAEFCKQNKKAADVYVFDISASDEDNPIDSYTVDEFLKSQVAASTDVPFDNEYPESNYFYITKHGIGPGMLPKDVEVSYITDYDDGLTSFYLDRFLTTDELKYYDVYPETHPIYKKHPDWIAKVTTPNEDEMYDDWQKGYRGRFNVSSSSDLSLIDQLPEAGWCVPYELSEDEKDIIDTVSEKHVTSYPTSGDWETELESEMLEIGEALAIDEKNVNYIMINYLGIDPMEVKTAWANVSSTYKDMLDSGMSEDDILKNFQ